MKFLFQYNVIRVLIGWVSMVFKVVLHHFTGYIAGAPSPLANGPKVATPITLAQLWKFFLKPSGTPTFQTLDNVTDVLTRTVFNMDMHMAFANNPFKDFNILRIANLFHQIPTTHLNISLEDLKTIFCNPNYMGSKPRNSMASPPLFLHLTKIQKWVATESLALKVHSFN